MAHLGSKSESIHLALAQDVVRHSVDRVYTFGRWMAILQNALPEGIAAGHFTTHEELFTSLRADLHSGDVITVKASLPSRFGRLVNMFASAQTHCDTGHADTLAQEESAVRVA
jgi:UDP-N-acetylmuramyl pentapeptide synthase